VIDLDTILTASHAPLLLWIGFILLSKQTYKWYTFSLFLIVTLLLNHWLYTLIEVYARPVSFFIVFGLSILTGASWKRNFYFLSLTATLYILGVSWARFITHSINPDMPMVYVVTAKVILTLAGFILLNGVIKKIRILDIMTSAEESYKNLIVAFSAGTIGLYYLAHLLPFILRVDCDYATRLQLLNLSILTIPILLILLTINAIVNKEIKLRSVDRCLKTANKELEDVRFELESTVQHIERHYKLIHNLSSDLKEKETLITEANEHIEHLNAHLLEIGGYQEKAMKFEHDVRCMIRALTSVRQLDDREAFDELSQAFEAEASAVIGLTPTLPDLCHLEKKELRMIRDLIVVTAKKAADLSVEFNAEIPEPLPHIDLPPLDLVRILSNWLDNALEETIHTEDKWVNISFLHSESLDQTPLLTISVTNGCRKSMPFNINDLKKQGVTSKGTNGLGLSIVEDLAKKHDHVAISTEKEYDKFSKADQDVFIQRLHIKLDR